jgi:hypothetical protein
MNAPERVGLPPQEISTEVLIEKYAKNGETTVAEVRARVARHLMNEMEDRGPHYFVFRPFCFSPPQVKGGASLPEPRLRGEGRLGRINPRGVEAGIP